VRERARFVAPDAVEAGGERYTADRFLIATGSSDVIPPIDGLDEAGCITFKEAIDLTAPPESIFILGGGPVGCEFAEVFSSFGSQVTIADQLPRLLPNEDPEIGHLLTHHFLQRGVTVLTETTASRFERDGDRKRVTVKTPDGEDRITVDEVLVAVGRKPNTDVGLEEAGVEYDKGGVKVDGTLRTSNPRVYAAGDVAGPYRFTHAASYQGGIAVYNAFSDETVEVDYSAMPRCVYTSPEVATVGLTEEQARERFDPVYVGIAELGTLGRANTSEEFEGFVKVIADGERRLVGAAIVAPPAGEMIHELALAIRLGATADHVASTVHAFPTFSEAIPEACGSLEPAQHRREG
jgi:pyruvate/2-oxoglutarate dehydrogenase complex dihydrolipoamide dehydrogenase (E3) component